MTSDLFFELYRKLAAARKEPATSLPVLDELAMVCRDRKEAASSPATWLSDADDCLYEVAQSSTLFAAAVSSWLTTDADIELATGLIRKASVQHLQQPAAEIYDLSSIDEERAILVGCRLCARFTAPAVSLGWTLSLAISFPENDKTCQAVDHLLQYHVDEFPRTTLQLLSHHDSPFNYVEQAKAALAVLEEQEAWLEGLANLREFAMSTVMRLTLSGLKRSEERTIDRRAREMSIFSQIFTPQHFKYSTKTAVEFVDGNQVQETTLEMSPVSVAVEVPLSERTDPESGEARRRALWRGDLQ